MGLCRHCGVDDCEAKFHQCLDRDFSDRGFGAVHHLTVGAYMLQHNRYADGHELGMVDFVLRHLDRPPDERIRREIRRRADGAQRVARRDRDARPRRPRSGWSSSIADVDLTTADAYRTSVRAWAEAVARDLSRDQSPVRRTATE